MKLTSALFTFDDGESSVHFLPKNSRVVVRVDGKLTLVDNPNRHHKPCETHCRRLIWRAQAMAAESRQK